MLNKASFILKRKRPLVVTGKQITQTDASGTMNYISVILYGWTFSHILFDALS